MSKSAPTALCASPPAGRETAYRTALRHHLIERMLSEIFGMEWHEIHEEAERLEHAVSPAFEAKLREKLGEGGACPHGNAVLPVNPAERKRRGEMPALRSRRRPALHRHQPPGTRPQAAAVPARQRNRPRPEVCASSARTTTKPFRLSYLQETPSSAARPPKRSGCRARKLP